MADGKWGTGINEKQRKDLVEQITLRDNPETHPFLKEMNKVKTAGRSQLIGMESGYLANPNMKPVFAEAAALDYGQWVNKQVKTLQKAGKSESEIQDALAWQPLRYDV